MHEWEHIWYYITKNYLQDVEIYTLVLAYPRFAIHFNHCLEGWQRQYAKGFGWCVFCHKTLENRDSYGEHSMECRELKKAIYYNVGGRYHYAAENLFSCLYCPEQMKEPGEVIRHILWQGNCRGAKENERTLPARAIYPRRKYLIAPVLVAKMWRLKAGPWTSIIWERHRPRSYWAGKYIRELYIDI